MVDLLAAAVLVRGDHVLLCHRSPDRRWYPNVWDIPGGHVEDGEQSVDAVVREVQEELGVTITPHHEPFRIFKEDDFTMHVWVVSTWSGEVENLAPDEHDEIRWVSLNGARSLDLAHEASYPLLCAAVSSLRK